MLPRLHILTGPVHSGKTSTLLEWCLLRQLQEQVIRGILNPIKTGLKHFYDIYEKEYFEFEIKTQTALPVVPIGNYTFLASSFGRAQQIFLSAASQPANYLVIDEIGKLELKQQGLEPAITSILENLDELNIQNLLLVVRDHLLEQVVEQYKLHSANIIRKEDLKNC